MNSLAILDENDETRKRTTQPKQNNFGDVSLPPTGARKSEKSGDLPAVLQQRREITNSGISKGLYLSNDDENRWISAKSRIGKDLFRKESRLRV